MCVDPVLAKDQYILANVLMLSAGGQDDTVVASHGSYEDSLLKQVQINQKDNNNASD